jgi:glucosylceramidase
LLNKGKGISAASSRSQLLCATFKNVDGKLAIIVMNQSDEKIDYNMVIGDKVAVVHIPPHTIQKLIL